VLRSIEYILRPVRRSNTSHVYKQPVQCQDICKSTGTENRPQAESPGTVVRFPGGGGKKLTFPPKRPE
jgi:hypothetical protein